MKSRKRSVPPVDVFARLIQSKKLAPEGIATIVDRLRFGEDVKKDKKRAFQLALKGMRLRNPYLTWYVADAYEHGEGVKKSIPKALVCYKKAISLKSVEACTGLGVYYWNKGRSAKQRISSQHFYKQAVNAYRKAAKKNEPYALCNLGLCYENGEGVKESMTTAYGFYLRAAAQGHDNGMYKVGCCLFDGVGVSRDRRSAVKWLRAASALGHGGASKRLLALDS